MSNRHYKTMFILIVLLLGIDSPLLATVMPPVDDPVTGKQMPGDSLRFDPVFLNMGMAKGIDISQYEKNTVPPGTYRVDIYINQQYILRENIEFRKDSVGVVSACLTDKTLALLPLKNTLAESDGENEINSCRFLSSVLEDVREDFDIGNLVLTFTVAQADLLRDPRGYVNPSLWDYGATAGYLNYTGNAYHSTASGVDNDSFYSSLNGGLNLGSWYLRHNGSYSWQKDGEKRYESLNTYVQKDIVALKGRLIVGDSYSDGQMFDSVGFRGVKLSSDERMLPPSMRGYAPNIRGIARTNAKVSIQQNGSVIYQTTVAPGPFVIDDLYPTGYGGDLQVKVEEADGSVQSFAVPYGSVAQLLRPGNSRYELLGGNYRSNNSDNNPRLYQLSYQYGLFNDLTLNAGMQQGEEYSAYLLGSAISTPIGAISADITQAQTRDVPGYGTLNGQSYRITYNKFIAASQSNIALAAYRFSTRNYYNFSEATLIQQRMDSDPLMIMTQRKNRLSLSLNQTLGDNGGQLYVSGFTQNYWNRRGSDQQYQVGYSNNFKSLTYSLSISRTNNITGAMENSYDLMFSMPLGGNSSGASAYFTLNRDGEGKYNQQVSISGVAGQDNQYSYGTTASHNSGNHTTSGSVNGQYRSPYSTLSSSYSSGHHYQSYSAGMSGTIVAHPAGLSFSPDTGETIAIVSAKGASGASVEGYPWLKLDRWGNAIMTGLTPYQLNDVGLVPTGADYGVELESTSMRIAPHSGAIVMARFNTERGYPVLFKLTSTAVSIPAFGSAVVDAEGNNVGFIGQNQMAFVRLKTVAGRLTVQGDNQRCYIDYQLSEEKINIGQQSFIQMPGQCHD
ncbi:outer membrane usher protein [Klebsiella michiganensis]|uniref:fimbria/pilus outer membrane usher protein n=1 Tax=Klebsiella TaxID=570 RepID=UPI00104C34E3|nr:MULTISPECIES: fimbria/pilus outer membrane usher protein [Klebsiella]TCZ59195.1 fimbrial biogenesis outer membrane usher protein [Klebsiella grimontii]BBW74559.1 outer membrane usher protein [Klebsiella michiganensis]HDX8921058.1 fimbrial biogenesis outer membrane usher protein [Klebsiella michiganensis]